MNDRLTAHEIKALRQHLHLTQEEFAARIGATVSTVNRWEKGKHKISRIAQRLVEALLLRSEVFSKLPITSEMTDYEEYELLHIPPLDEGE